MALLWLILVSLTNVCEGLKVLQQIPWIWKFASYNFQSFVRTTNEYAAPACIPKILSSCILLWQLMTVFPFGWAAFSSLTQWSLDWGLVDLAFAAGLTL